MGGIGGTIGGSGTIGGINVGGSFCFGSGCATGSGLMNTLLTILSIFKLLIPILLALAVVVFFWGLVKFIYRADNESEHEQGKNLMLWGMIALFVMVAFWGIIGYVQRSLGISGSVVTEDSPDVSLFPTVR